MIATQAIKSNIMELIPNLKVPSSNQNSNRTLTNRKDIVSFDAMLSHKSVIHQDRNPIESDKTINTSMSKSEAVNTKKGNKTITQTPADSATQTSVKEETVKNVDKNNDNSSVESLDKLAKTIEEVKEIVLDTLEISEEELVSMMDALSLTMMDLLNPEVLKQLTLENAGTNDFMMLLTNEGLNLEMTNLINRVQAVLEESGLTQLELDEIATNEQEFSKLIELLQKNQKDTKADSSISDRLLLKEEVANSMNPEISSEISDKKSNATALSTIELSVERVTEEIGNQTENSANSDTNQGKEQKFSQVELTNQFVDQIVNSTQVGNADFTKQLQQMSEVREIANQIIEKIKVLIKPTQTSMEMTLNPEHLGKVALNITSKEGMITATFTAQNQVTKEAIESQLQTFKENLISQGIKVEAIEVNVSNFNFEGNSQMDQSNSNQQEAAKGKKSAFRIEVEDSVYLDDNLNDLPNSIIDYGNNFDYTA